MAIHFFLIKFETCETFWPSHPLYRQMQKAAPAATADREGLFPVRKAQGKKKK